MSGILASMGTSNNIRVNPDFMAPMVSGDGDDSSILVTSDSDPTVVAAALHRAAHRIQRLDNYGHEHPDDHEFEAAASANPALDWPSDVSGVFLSPLGATFVLDYAGGYDRVFATAAAAIITEELLNVGVEQAEIRALPRDLDDVYAGEPYLSY